MRRADTLELDDLPWMAWLSNFLALLLAAASLSADARTCAPERAVYLTLDTGHMGVAPLMAEVLARQQVQVSFFAAHERTQTGDGSLGSDWAPWWKARAAEGHVFASHTYDHTYWLADLPPQGGQARFKVRASAGPQQGQVHTWTAAQYCEELHRASRRLAEVTGQPRCRSSGRRAAKPRPLCCRRPRPAATSMWAGPLPAFWAMSSLASTHSNERLLASALANIRAGDVLMAHLGIWSRQDPWAPAVLEPLIVGLKQRGLCFATLREHPLHQRWVASQASPAGVR
jgi:peptidoglycan/xylan/chitin deacetylase (PgdA/CDA1 family)